MKTLSRLCTLTMLWLCVGCASFRSDVSGLYTSQLTSTHSSKVKVLFDFYHYHQTVGQDVIPKLLHRPGVSDWDDLFGESRKNLKNISEYRTFTNNAADIDDPARRHERDSLATISDYSIKIEILRERSFSEYYLGLLVSTLTLTTIPIPYTWDYSIKATVTDKSSAFVGEYERSASVTTWYQVLLIFFHPFHVEEDQNEEIYLEMLSNIFQQIDADGILK
jgi:hypothetical protein